MRGQIRCTLQGIHNVFPRSGKDVDRSDTDKCLWLASHMVGRGTPTQAAAGFPAWKGRGFGVAFSTDTPSKERNVTDRVTKPWRAFRAQ